MKEKFLIHNGINVYHCYKHENALMYWFSISKNDEFGFDIRWLPGYSEAIDPAELIKGAIDQKIIRRGMKVDDMGRIQRNRRAPVEY